MRAHRGQAAFETIVAVLFLTAIFLILFQLSQMMHARILLDHASARAARARAVGFNEFMCRKSARVAMIPISGRSLRTLPDGAREASRVPHYLSSVDEAHARALLEYEYWPSTELSVSSDASLAATTRATMRLHTADWRMDGANEIESHYPLYLFDQGR